MERQQQRDQDSQQPRHGNVQPPYIPLLQPNNPDPMVGGQHNLLNVISSMPTSPEAPVPTASAHSSSPMQDNGHGLTDNPSAGPTGTAAAGAPGNWLGTWPWALIVMEAYSRTRELGNEQGRLTSERPVSTYRTPRIGVHDERGRQHHRRRSCYVHRGSGHTPRRAARGPLYETGHG